ncbi:MAG: o-succinylbenzoate synthase [Azonexus sp.]
MNIVAADWLPYTLPFRATWKTSQGRIGERQGHLLRLRTAEGLTGWGDAAPLPAFGISEKAARDFAEETARLDLLAQSAGLPLQQWLTGQAPVQDLAINANLGRLADLTPLQLTAAAAAGYDIIKLKVGSLPLNDESALLRQLVLDAPPSLRFRLDANRAWNLTDANTFIAHCTDLPIDGLEEPLAQPNAASLAALQTACTFPLAIDESTALIDDDFLRKPPIRRLTIKPAREGGLLASMALALRARAAGLEIVVTSSLESGCGLLACAHLAAAVAPDAVHGLGTAEWFAEDTGRPPLIASGRLRLPEASGLGFQANRAYRT